MPTALTTEVTDSIAALDPVAWAAITPPDNPFLDHAFLLALEQSKSVGKGTSWVPRFVVVKQGAQVVGAAPAWLRGDSFGEYIFDWSWAEAASRAGVRYYPKISVAVPYTPATGPRLLTAPGLERAPIVRALADGLHALRRAERASSVHVLFCEDHEAEELAQHGFLRRASMQFHFRNPGYASFDALLDTFSHGDRKNVKRERRRVVEQGVQCDVVLARDLSPDDAAQLYGLYASTIGRKWGRPYLTEEFFRMLPTRLGDQAVIGLATKDGTTFAMSLSFEKGKNLYGRHYGAPDEVPGVHMELCYYRLIDRAIQNGMVLVEAGAQGEHKLKRGFLPVVTHSAHAIEDERLSRAIQSALVRERQGVLAEQQEYLAHAPFKEGALPQFPLTAGVPLVQKQS